MSVDFAKLNKPGLGSGTFGVKRSSTGVSAQAARNLANSSAATKSSIFSNTRSPNFVAGQNVAKQSSRYSYQGARMRANQPFVPRHTNSYSHSGYISSGFRMPEKSGIQKFMEGMQKTMIMGQAKAGVGTIGGIINAFSGSSQISQLTAGVSSLSGEASQGASMSSLGDNTASLMSATSFGQINNLENSVNTSKAGLDSSYKQIGNDMQKGINDILGDAQQGLQLAGVNIDTSALQLSTLDGNNLDGAMATIDKDIGNIRNFYESTLGSATQQLDGKHSEIQSDINGLNSQIQKLQGQRTTENAAQIDAQIQQLEQKLEKAKEDLKSVETAQKAVDNAVDTCQGDIDKLSQKKAEIKDIKQFEGAVKDKKYNLAKSQDKQMKDLMKQIDKYAKKGNSEAEIKEIKSQLSKLVADAHAAGTPIMNSKNQSYTNEFKQTIDKAEQSPYV